MYTTIFSVSGLMCHRCTETLDAEINQLAGVREVDVNLEELTVTVRSDEPIDEPAMRKAVDDAGFHLVLGTRSVTGPS